MRYQIAFLSGLFLGGSAIAADQPPGYAKQVKPFLAKYCTECHAGEKAKAGLVMESFQSLMKGGESGAVIVPGKPDESDLVLMVEEKRMPPKKAKQPKANEIGILRAWVAAGAKNDSATVTVAIPAIKPRTPALPAISALAYRPDGKLLAAAQQKHVILIDVGTNDVIAKLPDQSDRVSATTFTRDGQKLAVAAGTPSKAGEVHVYSLQNPVAPALVHKLDGHKDIIYDLAFSPDGKLLASCGYDRLIKLWDTVTGKEVRTLKDHSDTIYGLAFSPDGKLLASASADRALKIWDIATGRRLYTLSESTDWLYTVAWSPDGKHVAAGGVDKSIRIWQATATEGKLVQSAFAHEGPITRLVFSADSKMLYSLSEDRTIKSWDATRLVEKKTYAKQPETVLALAVRPDHKQMAIGRYDGSLLLLDEATGQVQAEPLKPKPPVLGKITPMSGSRGQAVRIRFEGKYLKDAEVVASHLGVAVKAPPFSGDPNVARNFDVTFPSSTPAGIYQLSLKNAAGQSTSLPFTVDLFPQIMEKESNDSPNAGQKISLPASVIGAANRPGDIDFYRFDVQAGQQLGVQVLAPAVGSKFDPYLELADSAGRTVIDTTDDILGYTFPKAGTYVLGIRDREYRGGAAMHYRLHMGDIPVITALFPIGLQRGTEAEIRVEGVALPVTSVRIKAPADAAPGTRIPVPIATPKGPPVGNASIVVGEFPETANNGPKQASLPVPGTANGRIVEPGGTDTWRFSAKKGQQLILETHARRLGSPLDSYVEVLDMKGQPVPRATLRCSTRTYTVLRDHDSASPGIRIESWDGMAMRDYVLIGSELVRIHTLPNYADEDCRFFEINGQRAGYLDTTPTQHALGEQLYKVEIHPPGTTFPPNGFPVFTITYRNDDGGPGYGKDSRLYFDPPVDGEYQVRVGDSRGMGGTNFAYRLTVRPPRPSFNITIKPPNPSVTKGGAATITVNADRVDGFDGPIDIRLENVPAGFTAAATSILPGERSTVFALEAQANAKNPAKVPPLKLVASAMIDGKRIVREVTGGVPQLKEPGAIVATTNQSEVVLQPGMQTTVTVKIERRNGFKGRVPVEVRGLPYGVRLLNVGLNGILITQQETQRDFVIYAEPWAQPTVRPFVVLAKHEGKGTEHPAKSLTLKVMAPK